MSGAASTSCFASRFLPWVLLAALLPAGLARADSTDEKKPGNRSLFILGDVDAYLEVKGEFSRTRVRNNNRRSSARDFEQKNREWNLEERIGLRLSGAFIDPRLVTYNTELSLAITQDWYREKIGSFDQSDNDNGHLFQYDSRFNFFPGKTVSGSLYSLTRENRISRRFQSTLDEQRKGYGTSWTFSHDRIPMELSYDYSETDRTGNRDKSDDEHFTENTLHYQGTWNLRDYHRLKFSFEHANIKQNYQGLGQPFETTRDLLTLEHELEFGEDSKHQLRTIMHWQEESGDFARDFFEIGPQLTLTHRDGLQTIYKYQFNQEQYEGLDVETNRVDFQVVHQLYTNLTTTLSLFGLHEDIENDIDTTQYGAAVDWQYNRKNRLGHFQANLSLSYDTEEVDGDNGRRIILNESGTFRDPVPIILRNRNVVLASILITDASNRRIFQIGRDYLVTLQGNALLIARLRGGRIADGDTILIDYEYNTPASGQLDSIRVDLNIEQRFDNGLTPYYRLSYRNQEDDASTGFFRRADRTNHHRVGANYQTKRFAVGAEFEVFDDTIDPYDAFHLNGQLHILQEAQHRLDLSSRLSRLFFEGGTDKRNVTLVDVELDHRWRLTEKLSTVERLAYRVESDSAVGDTRGWDATAGFEYVWGDLSGELTLEYDKLELPDSDEEDIGVYFRVRRDIPNVLRN